MMCYSYWSNPPTPNSSAGGRYTDPSWIGSTDGSTTWESDENAQSLPLAFWYQPSRGSWSSYSIGDPYLRGVGYTFRMGWCGDYAPGSSFRMFQYFFRVYQNAGGWAVYPALTGTTPQQYPPVIVSSDAIRGCFGTTRATILPSGRILCAVISNLINPSNYYGLHVNYSDNGGDTWQYGDSGRAAVYAASGTNPISVPSTFSFAVPYKGEALFLFIESGRLKSIRGNGDHWTTMADIGSVGYDREVLSAVCHKDSTVYLNIRGSAGEMSLIRYQNGTASTKEVIKASGAFGPSMTLCGERLWFVWIADTSSTGGTVCAKKYFINENRWSDDTLLVQGTGKIDFLELPLVSPPSHVPLVYREQSTVTDTVYFKMLRIPIDASEEALDPDFDGLENSSETAAGTDPDNADGDGDGLWDGQEVVLLGTNPKATDTDGDGDNDAVEVYHYTHPCNAASNTGTNQPPVASLEVANPSGEEVHLDAGASTDPEHEYLTFSWEILTEAGQTLTAEGARVSVREPVSGAVVTVRDIRGGESVAGWGSLLSNERMLTMTGPLLSVAPNPFSLHTRISFNVQTAGKVMLNVYNLQGKLIKKLIRGERPMGRHTLVLKADHDEMSPGLYIVRLKTGTQSRTAKMVVVK